jgi:hypothetical protein
MGGQGEMIIILCWMWQTFIRTQIVGAGVGIMSPSKNPPMHHPLGICYDSFLDEVHLRYEG